MDAFMDAWLDQLSAMDALRLCAAHRRAREALGADGVAAAAFAVTRPWRANPAGTLRLWRRAWAACSSASTDLGLHGEAWLKPATVIPLDVRRWPYSTYVGVTLDVASARALAEDGIRMLRRARATSGLARKVIAILLITANDATFDADTDICEVELNMLVLFQANDSWRNPCWFGAAIPLAEDVPLTANPLRFCQEVAADGIVDKRLLIVQKRPSPFFEVSQQRALQQRVALCLRRLSSDMKRVARDGKAYDLFEWTLWLGATRGLWRWREAPPLHEVPCVREIALAGMLTRSALGLLTGRMLTR